MKLKYYKNLDGVRALAALMVMFFHFFRKIDPSKNMPYLFSEIVNFGQTGVTLFFVLSGFLITRILIDSKNTKCYFKNFFVRRSLRIFPLYYLFLIIWYYIAPLFIVIETGSFDQQIYYFTYLQGFARTFGWDSVGPHHFWSLAVEEHFYLFWPLFIHVFSTNNLKYVILAIMIFAIILRMIMLDAGYSVFIFTFTRFDSLAIGALLALMELKNYFNKENQMKFLLFFGSTMVLFLTVWFLFSGKGNNFVQNARYILLSLAYFAGIAYLLSLRESSLINKFLKSNFLNYTGKISYGLYVYHPLIFIFCLQHLEAQNIFINFVIMFSLSYAVAAFSYHYFETRFLNLKKYFEYKIK